MEHSLFISWQEAQAKFGFLDTKAWDWDLITRLVMHEWHDIFERDTDRVRHGTWVGSFTYHLSDPVVVLMNEAAFDPPCIRKTWLTLAIPISCFRASPQSRCL